MSSTTNTTNNNININNPNVVNANAHNPSARAMAAEPNRNSKNKSPHSGEDSRPDEGPLKDANTSLLFQTLKADGTPKRPMNGFMIFARRRRPQLSAQNPEKRTGEISKILSSEWISMAASEKRVYQDLAKKLLETFRLKYPNYVYCCRRNNSRKKRRMDAAPYNLSASPHEYQDDYDSISPVDGPPYRLHYGGIDRAYYSHGHSRQYTEPIPAMNPTVPAPALAPVSVYGGDHHPHPHPHPYHAHSGDDHFSSQPPQPQQQWHPSSYPPARTHNASFRNNSKKRNRANDHSSKAGHAVAAAAAVTHGGAGAAGGGAATAAGAGPGSLGGTHGSAGSYDSQLRLGARRGMIPPPINAISHHNYHGHHGTNGHGHDAAQQQHHARHWSDDTGSSVSPPSSGGLGVFPPAFGSCGQQLEHHPRHWSDDTGSSVSPPCSGGSGVFPPAFGSCGPGNGGNGYGTLNGFNGCCALTPPFFPSTSPSTSSVRTRSSSAGPTAGTTGAALGGYYSHTRGGAAPDTYASHLHSSHTVSHHPHHTSTTLYSHTLPHLAPTPSLSPIANGLWSSMHTKAEICDVMTSHGVYFVGPDSFELTIKSPSVPPSCPTAVSPHISM